MTLNYKWDLNISARPWEWSIVGMWYNYKGTMAEWLDAYIKWVPWQVLQVQSLMGNCFDRIGWDRIRLFKYSNILVNTSPVVGWILKPGNSRVGLIPSASNCSLNLMGSKTSVMVLWCCGNHLFCPRYSLQPHWLLKSWCWEDCSFVSVSFNLCKWNADHKSTLDQSS